MNQTSLTFVLAKDGLQASPLSLHSTLGLYYKVGEAPLAQGGYGLVFKCFQPTTGSLRPCVAKMVPLSVGGTFAVEDEYNRLCAVLHIPGIVKVLQQPVYTATHGFLVTEYVDFCRQVAQKHQFPRLHVKRCQLTLTGAMTCRFIQGDSLAEYLLRAAPTNSTFMAMTRHWRTDLLQELCRVSAVAQQAQAHVVLSGQLCFYNQTTVAVVAVVVIVVTVSSVD